MVIDSSVLFHLTWGLGGWNVSTWALSKNWRWHLTEPNVFLLNVLFRSTSKYRVAKGIWTKVWESACACVCVCVQLVSVFVLIAPGSPAQTKLPVRGLTSPTPQSTIHRGQLGHAVRLLWYVTVASLSLFSLYLSQYSSFSAFSPSYSELCFYSGRQCSLWGQRCQMSPSGASYYWGLLTLHTISHAFTHTRDATNI